MVAIFAIFINALKWKAKPFSDIDLCDFGLKLQKFLSPTFMFATVYARKVVIVKVSTQLLHFIISPDKTY